MNYLEDKKQLPSSLSAEQSVIGAILQNPNVIADVQEVITAEDFFFARERKIMECIYEKEVAGSVVDFITVAEVLNTDEEPILAYLIELVQNVAGSSNVVAYANMIKDLSIKRSILAASSAVTGIISTNPSLTREESINVAQSAMSDFENSLTETFTVSDANTAAKNYVMDLDFRMRRGDELNGLSTGFDSIDQILDGIKNKQLIIIAGRPSMGKTTYALQVAGYMSLMLNKCGIIFSLEMSETELTEKLIACFGCIDLEFLQNPKKHGTEEVWPKLESAVRKVKKAPLHIADCSDMHINQIKSYSKKFNRKKTLDFIVIDHINLMSGDGDNEVNKISSITRGLKLLAKQMGIPVIALSQLSRKVEERGNKRPMLSDLRGSGSIEQDADIIQFVYRDDYYNDDPNLPNKGLVEIITAKHRGGKKGTSVLENKYHQSRLDNTTRFISSDDQPKPYAKKRPDF